MAEAHQKEVKVLYRSNNFINVKQMSTKGEIRTHDYMNVIIPRRDKYIMAQLRTNVHRLRCEIGKWEQLKEEWGKMTCEVCEKEEAKTEQHFLLHYEVHVHIWKITNLQFDSWHTAFQEDQL